MQIKSPKPTPDQRAALKATLTDRLLWAFAIWSVSAFGFCYTMGWPVAAAFAALIGVNVTAILAGAMYRSNRTAIDIERRAAERQAWWAEHDKWWAEHKVWRDEHAAQA